MRLDTWLPKGLQGTALMALSTLGGLGGCRCLAPDEAEALVATGFLSPRQTVESFQLYLQADLPEREYRCFSQGFRARNGLSAFGYGEARDELFRRYPWLAWIADARIVSESAVESDVHQVVLEALGRTVHVKLVREDFFEIRDDRGPLVSEDADFERLVRETSEGRRLTLNLPLDRPLGGLEGIGEVLVARHWKIDELSEPSDEPTP